MNLHASVERDERLRLFCALQLPESVGGALEAWAEEHLPGRRVPRSQLHVTLAYLGPRSPADRGPVAAALAAAVDDTEKIVFAAWRYRETRGVGMLELEDVESAGARLARRLYDRLEELGVYRRERRGWLPHVTALRFREPPGLRPPLPALGRFSPSGAAVYHSVLRPTGPQYDVVESVALGG